MLCLLGGETWCSSRWWLEEGNASRLSASEMCPSLRRRRYLAGKSKGQRVGCFTNVVGTTLSVVLLDQNMFSLSSCIYVRR